MNKQLNIETGSTDNYNQFLESLSNKFHFTGELTLKNTTLEMNYGLYNNSRVANYSITDFLNHTYKNYPSSPLKVIIKELDSGNIIYSYVGNLHIAKDSDGILGWHIDQYPLEADLFNLVDRELEVFICRLDAVNIAENTEASGHHEQSRKRIS